MLLMRKLIEIIHQEKDSFIRIKISSILSEYRKIPKFDIQASIYVLLKKWEFLIYHLLHFTHLHLTDHCK